MAMARKVRPLTEDEQAKLDEFREQAKADPLDWFKHDNDAHTDEGVRLLIAARGMEAYGLYWCLMEVLAARKNHCYDVSTELGWQFLAKDMSPGVEVMGVDECMGFIRALAEHGLIDRECLEESGHVISNRICRNAAERNESTAQNKFKGWRSGRARRGEGIT